MNQIESTEGKILYLIYELYSRNEISDEQRGTLKDHLIARNNMRFMTAVRSYEKNKDADWFQRFLVDYVNRDLSFLDVLSVESQRSIKSQQHQTVSMLMRQESMSTDTHPILTMLSATPERRTDRDLSFKGRGSKKSLTQKVF